MTTCLSKTVTTHSGKQHGVAAIEFGIVFVVLFLMLYGIATFGAVLYVKQALARAAEDGARAASMQLNLLATNAAAQGKATENIRSAARTSLERSLVVPNGEADPASWISNNVDVDVEVISPNVTVTVTYDYSANRILPLLKLPGLDASRWMPERLTQRATAAMPT